MPKILEMTVEVDHIEPKIWRRVEIPEGLSLAAAHEIIQILMGWDGGHLFEFSREDRRIGIPTPGWDAWGEMGPEVEDAREVTLRDVVGDEARRLSYLYDFGDNWELTLYVEERKEAESGVQYPRCMAGERAGPPEDCGGVWGYMDIVEGMESGRIEPELAEWLDGWEPEGFDPEDVELPPAHELQMWAGQEYFGWSTADMGAPAEWPVLADLLAPNAEVSPRLDAEQQATARELEEKLAAELEHDDEEAALNTVTELARLELGLEDEEAVTGRRENLRSVLRGLLNALRHGGAGDISFLDNNLKTFPSTPTLEKCLKRLSVDQLDQIFDNLSNAERPPRRAEREEQIIARLRDTRTMERLVDERLGREERSILDYVLSWGGSVSVDWFTLADLIEPDPFWLTFESDTPLGHLRRLGLMHVGTKSAENNEEIVIAGIPLQLREMIDAALKPASAGDRGRPRP